MSVTSNENLRDEDVRSLYILIGASIGLHLLIFILSFFKFFSPPKPIIQEWAMDTELLTEEELGSAHKTVIPKAEKDKEVLVPDNQLPQLTKTFTVQEKVKEEEGLLEEKKPEKIEEGLPKPNSSEDGQENVKPDVTVKLKKSEALERLVREKLKDKTRPNNRRLTAEDNTDLAQIRDLLKDKGSTPTTGGIAGLSDNNKYKGYLTGVIRRNYQLPTTYQLQRHDMRAILAITIDASGGLKDVEVSESSGDTQFDDYCIATVNKSAPFDPPPEPLAGETILVECKP